MFRRIQRQASAAGVVAFVAGAACAQQPNFSSQIRIYDFAAKSSTVVHRAGTVWEAPNWSRDGKFLLANSGGKLYRILVDGSAPPALLSLDPELRCNNDHDFSPDGKLLAISAYSATSERSQVYVANADGSAVRLLVSAVPSYFHGWSPDGKFLAFVANRDGKQFDLYRVAVGGGAEEPLTADAGNDDGPDYSPSGRWIYFNSDRGGGWNIWRMPPQGAGAGDRRAQRVTNDELEDWFAHPSPDGKWLVFLSFPAGTDGHDHRDRHVKLRMIPLPGNTVHDTAPQIVTEFNGGQGSINVNSWSPDSKRFAYVTYEPVNQQAGSRPRSPN